MPYALLDDAGSIKSLFARPQPDLDLMYVSEDSTYVEVFRGRSKNRSVKHAASRACLDLYASIIGDTLDVVLAHAIADERTSSLTKDSKVRAQIAVGAGIDIARARAKFRTSDAADVNNAVAQLQATLDAIADTCSVEHIVIGDRE